VKFRVTVEVENPESRPWPESVATKVNEWTERLLVDRLNGIKRASKGLTKVGHRYKAVIADVLVERDG
jgi:hypothetical protein